MTILAVVLGGALGATTRYAVSELIRTRCGAAFPYGILVANVSGSCLLGYMTQAGVEYQLDQFLLILITSGFCGGYTTFSTFALDTQQLAASGARGAAGFNIVANTAGSVSAAWIGVGVASSG